MADQWDKNPRCPQCRRTGMVSLSQFLGAIVPTVNLITSGPCKPSAAPTFIAVPATSRQSRKAASGGLFQSARAS